MAYLIAQDYLRTIQDVNLQQIITGNEAIKSGVELAAQAEAISYLRQKYIVTQEFTNTTEWVEANSYSARDRVYLDAAAYVTTNTYAIGDYCLYSGQVYRCNTAGTTGAFNSALWDKKGAQFEIFSAVLPFPEFDLLKLYETDDQVYWKGKIYKCLTPTALPSHETDLQYRNIQSLPPINTFPDTPVKGPLVWSEIEAYLIPGDTDILNEAYWAQQDNRDQQMVMYFTDITLYHLHSRITPRNIPQLRTDRYNAAVNWLMMCAKGEITPGLPVIQPKQGRRIRYGGAVRNINNY